MSKDVCVSVFPVVYLVIYALLCLKLLSIRKLIKEFITTRDRLIDKTQSELSYPLIQQDDRLLKNAPNAYDNQLKSFFFLDALLHKNKLAIIISFILLYVVPLAVLIKGMLVFLPYQSWIISISHWIVILALTGLCIHLINIIEKQEKNYKPLPLWKRVWVRDKAITIPHLTSPKGGGTGFLYKIGLFSSVVPILFCICSVVALYNRMENGKIDYPIFSFQKTALDLSNKTLIKKPTPDAILAKAYEQDLQSKDKDKTHFVKAKWYYAEGHFLRNRSFKGINLSHATAYKIDLQESDLKGADLWNANLQGANLNGINLTGADLGHVNFTNVRLSLASLASSFLYSANLSYAELIRTDLRNVSLRNVNLSYTILIGSNLKGVDFIDVNFNGAIYNTKRIYINKKIDWENNKIDKSTMHDICSDVIENEYVMLNSRVMH